jgi:hypothetical protein
MTAACRSFTGEIRESFYKPTVETNEGEQNVNPRNDKFDD